MARVDNILQTEVSYSGFLNVNRTHNSSLFFWFFPAKKNAKDSPLLLWLEGGPGKAPLALLGSMPLNAKTTCFR